MVKFCVQFQPALVASGFEERVLSVFRDAVPDAHFVEGDDDGGYVNITFDATSETTGWATVVPVLSHPEVGRAASRGCIIICEGKHGWDDYVMLHHPDRTLISDKLPAVPADE